SGGSRQAFAQAVGAVPHFRLRLLSRFGSVGMPCGPPTGPGGQGSATRDHAISRRGGRVQLLLLEIELHRLQRRACARNSNGILVRVRAAAFSSCVVSSLVAAGCNHPWDRILSLHATERASFAD